MFTLEAIAIRCTASLRTIDNHFGLRGVIPLFPGHALTALSMRSSLPTCREGCPATVGFRERVGSVVSAVLACCSQLLQRAHDWISHASQSQCVARCLDSLVVPTRLFSHALHHVVLRCHDDCVEDGSAQ